VKGYAPEVLPQTLNQTCLILFLQKTLVLTQRIIILSQLEELINKESFGPSCCIVKIKFYTSRHLESPMREEMFQVVYTRV
jgi:hypothetical protein